MLRVSLCKVKLMPWHWVAIFVTVKHWERTFMLALSSRIVVLLGSLVSLEVIIASRILTSQLSMLGLFFSMQHWKASHWLGGPVLMITINTHSHTRTSLRAMRCCVLSGAAGLSDLNPQWCARWIGTEDFLVREGYVVPSPSTWAEAAFDKAFLPSARWGAWG
jgi:hypothetical protein